MAYRIVRVTSRCKLETQLNYLVCRTDKETRILLDEISTIIIENPQICLTGSLISELLSHKVRIVFCDLKHNPQGEVEPLAPCYDSSLKLQKQIAWRKETKAEVWKRIIEMKIHNQAECMKRHNASPDRIKAMAEFENSVEPDDPTNREGQAARIYFNSIFGEDFDRRDEYNKINTFLNYGYAMVLSLVNREIAICGYSNLLGIHHRGAENPFNLGCDFVEPLRPLIDDFALSSNLSLETFKKDMLNCLTGNCRCNNKTMVIQNAVDSYIASVLSALTNDLPEKIATIGFEDGDNI